MSRAVILLAALLAATGAKAQDSTDVQQLTTAQGQPIHGSQPAQDKSETPAQVSGQNDRQKQPPQLTAKSGSKQQPSQVATGPRNAEPPQPLSTPEQGRTAAIDRVDGDDRCDPASDEDKQSAKCRDIIENRAAEFERRRAQMSPEQRLLIDQQIRNAGETIADATRRLARSGQDDSLEAMGVASIVLYQPPPEKPDEEKNPGDKATAEAIANFLNVPPPQQ